MKRTAKIVFLGLTTSVAVAGAYAYLEYRKTQLDAEAERLWALLGLRRDAHVADVGAGAGDMAQHMAYRVGPGGRVFAAESDSGKLRKLARRKTKPLWENVAVVESGPESCNLPENGCDAVYLRGVYHHLTDPDLMNRSLLRALRPGGTLAIVDFPPRTLLSLCTPKGIPENRDGHGIRREIMVEEMERAGFELVRTIEKWPGRRYCVLFRKPISTHRVAE